MILRFVFSIALLSSFLFLAHGLLPHLVKPASMKVSPNRHRHHLPHLVHAGCIELPTPSADDIHLFNTLTRSKEKFVPIEPGKVSFYRLAAPQARSMLSNEPSACYNCTPPVIQSDLMYPLRLVATIGSCGPTVYDYAHIGNFRAFLTYDMVKRWLMYCNYDVDHVCNLTDIDDKIIIKMTAEGKSLQEITTKYSKAFFEDLNVSSLVKINSICSIQSIR